MTKHTCKQEFEFIYRPQRKAVACFQNRDYLMPKTSWCVVTFALSPVTYDLILTLTIKILHRCLVRCQSSEFYPHALPVRCLRVDLWAKDT